jgi:ectoine hydroxylase-related dioxygenase (phytanoyl-CoA dioxygenase family)
MSLTAAAKRRLDEDGYLALEGFIDAALLAALRNRLEELFAEEGEQAGREFKPEPGCRRLANLVDKGEVFERVIALPALLGYVAHVLGPAFKLSSLNARSVPPGFVTPQPLHADMAAVADERGYWVCNTVWLLDDFTPANGAIRAVPGSHAWRRLPQEVLPDPRAPHPQEVLLTGKAGTVLVMNAHLWHGGLGNHSAAGRTALHAFYARRDKPQQQYQKRLLRPEVQARLAPPVRGLLALDDPLNDQLSGPAGAVSGFLK